MWQAKNTPYFLKHKAVKNQNALHAKKIVLFERDKLKSIFGLKKFILGSTFDSNWKGRGNSVLLGNFLSNYNEFI